MAFFEKKSTVFRKQDKAGWLSAKETLKTAGIRGIRAGRYDVEPPVCGCGAKLDPRNFGAKGPIDRSMYFIEVPLEEVERARALLSVSAGVPQSSENTSALDNSLYMLRLWLKFYGFLQL